MQEKWRKKNSVESVEHRERGRKNASFEAQIEKIGQTSNNESECIYSLVVKRASPYIKKLK